MQKEYKCYLNYLNTGIVLREYYTGREVNIKFNDDDSDNYIKFIRFISGCDMFGDIYFNPFYSGRYISVTGESLEEDDSLVVLRDNDDLGWYLV